MGVVSSIVISVATGIIVVEFYMWEPKLTRVILRLAVRRAPPAQRVRLEEEWRAHLDEVPAGFTRLTTAVGFLWSATALSKGSQAPANRETPTVVGFLVTTTKLIYEFTFDNDYPAAIRSFRLHRLKEYIRMSGEMDSKEKIEAAWDRATETAWNKLSARKRAQLLAAVEKCLKG